MMKAQAFDNKCFKLFDYLIIVYNDFIQVFNI